MIISYIFKNVNNELKPAKIILNIKSTNIHMNKLLDNLIQKLYDID